MREGSEESVFNVRTSEDTARTWQPWFFSIATLHFGQSFVFAVSHSAVADSSLDTLFQSFSSLHSAGAAMVNDEDKMGAFFVKKKKRLKFEHRAHRGARRRTRSRTLCRTHTRRARCGSSARPPGSAQPSCSPRGDTTCAHAINQSINLDVNGSASSFRCRYAHGTEARGTHLIVGFSSAKDFTTKSFHFLMTGGGQRATMTASPTNSQHCTQTARNR